MTVHKLYSDGNYFPRAKRSGYGGYIKNEQGDIITEYSEEIKNKNYTQNFELLGIIRGLEIAKAHNIKHIISYCDDKTTAIRLKSIFESGEFNIPDYGKPELFRKIMEISNSFDTIEFNYIPRGENKYADLLSRRYATSLEKSFTIFYKQELQDSQEIFSESGKLPKRVFFAHQSLVKIINRNNPYMVASFRNQRVRCVTREEEKKNYSFIFFETFIEKDNQFFRIYDYGQERERKSIKNFQLPLQNGEIENCAIIFNRILKNNKHENLWVSSNHAKFNAIMEQKEKIPSSKMAESFRPIHKSLESHKRVLFHHFPFEHVFSRNLQAQNKKQVKLKTTFDDLQNILEALKFGKDGKNYSKHVGSLIRYHLRDYQNIIKRDLEESEKTVIINKTFQSISNKTFKPSFQDIILS